MPMDEEFLNVLNRQEADEQAAAKKAALEQQVLEGVQAGTLQVGEETLSFRPRLLLDERVCLTLPDSLAPMDPELAALKYPSERRPDPVFSNTAGSVSLGFTHTQTEVRDETIGEFTRAMQQTLQRMQSSAQFMDDGVKIIHGRQMGWFEFTSPALDGDIYNRMGFVELSGTALMIGFNCPAKVMAQWRPVAGAILATLEIVTAADPVESSTVVKLQPIRQPRED